MIITWFIHYDVYRAPVILFVYIIQVVNGNIYTNEKNGLAANIQCNAH